MTFFARFVQRMRKEIAALTPLEQLLAIGSVVVIATFFYSMAFQATHQETTLWPQTGGVLTAGGMGTPRLIHPLYAETSTERDLVALVYTGLMKETDDGTMAPALAESYTRSNSGDEYTFFLRPDAVFHDGIPVTADDVVYTIEQAQNPAVNNYLAVVWNARDIRVKKIDTHTVQITNAAKNTDFVEYMTLGILPSHVWQDMSPDEQLLSSHMTEAVGAGPFHIANIKTNRDGLPELFSLKSFDGYVLGQPHLRGINYRLYDSRDDFVNDYLQGALDMMRVPFGADPGFLPSTHTLDTTTLTGLFVSRTSSSPLVEKEVLTAISYLIDRQDLVAEVYGGRANPHTSMLPKPLAPEFDASSYNPEKGLELLAEAGWTFDQASATMNTSSDTSQDVSTPFSFTLATVNAPHLVASAEYIRMHLARYGIDTTIDIYTSEAFHDDIIPNRSFDALLFGLGLETPSSLGVFWHSKHRKAFNITEYTNPATDALLDDAHTEFDSVLRASLYQEFDTRITQDAPAIMLYSQSVGVATNRRFTTPMPSVVDTRHQQFDRAHEWFRYGAPVWTSFANPTETEQG